MNECHSFGSLTAFVDEGVGSDGANPEKVAAAGKTRLLADRLDKSFFPDHDSNDCNDDDDDGDDCNDNEDEDGGCYEGQENIQTSYYRPTAEIL